jgi:uncharacterized membrane protein YbhN (UPF0104 family)
VNSKAALPKTLTRILRVVLLLVALAFCAYSLISQWDETRAALTSMSWGAVGGAFLAGLAGLFAWMLGWRAFLAGLGSPLPLRAAARVTYISQLGKYVPGKVWALVSQIELARAYDVPRLRSVSATLLAVATSIAAGLAVAAATLPLTSPAATDRYWWLFPLAPLMLAGLHPRIVTWGLNLVLKVVRRPQLEHPVSMSTTLRAVAWTMLGWALLGVQTWLLCLAAGGTGAGLPFLATGAYALAFTAGFIVFIAPGGIGAREAALVICLSPVLPAGTPILVAIVSRVVLTAADLVNAGVAVLLGRRPGTRTAPRQAQGERAGRSAGSAGSDRVGP